MSKGREIHSFDYVNHPYEAVCQALRAEPQRVFHDATRAAASRAHAVASELRANIAGVEVGTDVVISVGEIREEKGPLKDPKTVMPIEWEAASRPGLFPLMHGELSIYRLTGKETQLDFRGEYEPPLGLVGSAIDAVAGHRIAEASVHRFLADVGRYLRETIEH